MTGFYKKCNTGLKWAASKKTREHFECTIKCFAMGIEHEYLQDDL